MPKLSPKFLDTVLHADTATDLQPFAKIEGIPIAYENIVNDEMLEFKEDTTLNMRFEKITPYTFPELAKIKGLFTRFAEKKITPTLNDLPEHFIKFFSELFQHINNVNSSTLQINMNLFTEEYPITIPSPCLSDLSPLEETSDCSSAGEPPSLGVSEDAPEQWTRLADSSTYDLTELIREVSYIDVNGNVDRSRVISELSESLSHLKEIVAETEEKRSGLLSLAKSLSDSLSGIKELSSEIKADELNNLIESPQKLSRIEEILDTELKNEERKIIQDLGKDTPKAFTAKCIFMRSNTSLNPKLQLPLKARLHIEQAQKYQAIKRSFTETHNTCLALEVLEEEKILTAKKCEELLKKNQNVDLAISCPSSFFMKQIPEGTEETFELTPAEHLSRIQSN